MARTNMLLFAVLAFCFMLTLLTQAPIIMMLGIDDSTTHVSFTDTTCQNPMKLMPLCERCIPGLVTAKDGDECEISDESAKIRKELFEIAASRGNGVSCEVYKYLSTETLRKRQQFAANLLDKIAPKHVLDIGPYTNPIHSFMNHCPNTIFMVEPCGELAHDGNLSYLSKVARCTNFNGKVTRSIQHVLPQSIKSFITDTRTFKHFDAIVCVGCDTTYGPTWKQLMNMPKPFHLILEFSVLAFQKDYPIESTDGCDVLNTHIFDFSECPDCGYENDRQQSQYGKKRQIVIFHCPENIQKNTVARAAEAINILASFCRDKNANNISYNSMACSGERMIFTINDTALMAVEANKPLEESDKGRLISEAKKLKRYNGDCPGMKNPFLAREWWDVETNDHAHKKAHFYLGQAKNNATNLYEGLCLSGSARQLFSAAQPQELVIAPLYESIQLYQSFFKAAVATRQPPEIFNEFRFPLKICPPHLDRQYAYEVAEMEPIIPMGRNMDYWEFGNMISFNPYRPLASFKSVRNRAYTKKILIDVGANGFSASPKQLVDNYGALGMQFDELIMFEPDIKGMQKIPDLYYKMMKITFHQQFVQVGTRTENDLLPWLNANVQKDDFVVLKFDVDEDNSGPTMEWAFLADLIYSKSIALVDEVYIELHFRNRLVNWKHETHSCRQHYDVLRQLRGCGMAIHDWP